MLPANHLKLLPQSCILLVKSNSPLRRIKPVNVLRVCSAIFISRSNGMKRLLALTLSFASIGFIAASAEAKTGNSFAAAATANAVRQITIRIGSGSRRYNRRYNRRTYNRGYYPAYNRSYTRSYNRSYYPTYGRSYSRTYTRVYYPTYNTGYYRSYNRGYNTYNRGYNSSLRRAYRRGFVRGYTRGANRSYQRRYAAGRYVIY